MARKMGGKRTTTLMDGKPVTLDLVRTRIRETGKSRPVLVELHVWESVTFGDVAVLCAACDDAAGISFVDPSPTLPRSLLRRAYPSCRARLTTLIPCDLSGQHGGQIEGSFPVT
ncbi:MAG: hypothetical protein JRJ24_18600 [Deltaproteobacteria bacterium]|nr:hypothetical protein [Deltaproteobacteria bacterium]